MRLRISPFSLSDKRFYDVGMSKGEVGALRSIKGLVIFGVAVSLGSLRQTITCVAEIN
jgi:hypothetical protein